MGIDQGRSTRFPSEPSVASKVSLDHLWMLWDFLDSLKVSQIRVQNASKILLVCGGQVNNVTEPPASMRDAFIRHNHDGIEIYLAEDVNFHYISQAAYTNILVFERDLAQICGLVLLFCESEGSYAELGAFSNDPEIAAKMLVVIREKFLTQESFIELGPLKILRNISANSVFSVTNKSINITYDKKSKKEIFGLIDISSFGNLVQEPVKLRLDEQIEHTTFNESRPGHRIKLITGFVQEFGALTKAEISEIANLLFAGYISDSLIENYILCAKTVGWVHERQSAFDTYILPKLHKDAATFEFNDEKMKGDKQRRRLNIREHYQKHDRRRYDLITDSAGGDDE